MGITTANLVNNNLTITLSNASVITVGNVLGPQGPQGATGAQGTVGATGATGVGVTTANLVNNNLTLTLSNAAVITVGNVLGPTGPQGPQGATGAQGNTNYTNANVTAYLPTDATITGIQSNIATVNANIGAFHNYANSAIASLTSSSGTFTGNFAGNVAYDSTRGGLRINQVNALGQPLYPDTTYASSSNYTNQFGNVLYSGNNIVKSGSGAGISPVLTAVGNVVLTTAGSGGFTANPHFLFTQFWGYQPSGNLIMATGDQLRGTNCKVEHVNQGMTWGTIGSNADQASNRLLALNGNYNLVGYGNIGTVIGMNGIVSIQPKPQPGGYANVQYATSSFSIIQLQSTYGATAQANVAYARLFGGTVTSQNSNLTIQNAIGLHTHSGWAASIATNKYVVLNEDSGSVIQTNGNIVATGSLLNYSGSNAYVTASTVTLTGGTTNILSSNTTVTGSNLLVNSTSTFAGATKFTNSVQVGVGSYNSAGPTFAIPVYTVAALNSMTGSVGQIVAVVDYGGQPAWWDSSTNHWRFMSSNTIVS